MSKIKVVELWGGPGSGKSTTAAGLFARLKVEEPPAGGPKRSVELVTEHAKEITWWLAHLAEGRPSPVALGPIWREAPGLHLEVPGDASAPEVILHALGGWIDGATS